MHLSGNGLGTVIVEATVAEHTEETMEGTSSSWVQNIEFLGAEQLPPEYTRVPLQPNLCGVCFNLDRGIVMW